MAVVLVAAELAAPVVGTPVHLDGLLALAWARRHPRHSGGLSRRDQSAPDPHLPLRRVTARGASVWLASAAMVDGASEPASLWQTKRRAPEDWDHLAKTVQVTAGPSKDCLIRRQAIAAERLCWLACGSRNEIRKSLKLLWGPEDRPHGMVGSVRRAGAGEIRRWSIERVDRQPVDCIVQGARAVRNLPSSWVEDVADHRWGVGATRPPYWLPAYQERVPSIGAPVTLHSEVEAALA